MTDAVIRKQRSEDKLKELGIPVNPHLPLIESEADIKLRTPEEVAKRAIVLCAMALCGEAGEQQEAIAFLQERRVWEAVTPKEQALLLKRPLAYNDRVNLTWRYESFWVLLWALGHIKELAYPSTTCDVALAVGQIVDTPSEQFIAQARLRAVTEILDEADLIYRYDWAVVDSRLQQVKPPGELHPGVVYERHYALNWLVGYLDQNWDDVTTDT